VSFEGRFGCIGFFRGLDGFCAVLTLTHLLHEDLSVKENPPVLSLVREGGHSETGRSTV
jgi:hypothetical protein